MKHGFLTRHAVGLGSVLAMLAIGPASAEAAATPLQLCTSPPLTQPFLSFGDQNDYAITGGQSYDSFTGTGWTLLGGAKIVTTKLWDGTTNSVLDVPSGGIAISPAMCVNQEYPEARTMVRQVKGTAAVNLYVAYVSASNINLVSPAGITGTSAWSLSPQETLKPGNLPGWQHAWFTFVGSGSGSETQLYNFYIDPRMGH